MTKDDLFGLNRGFFWNKPKRFWICQCSMPLWTGLQLYNIHVLEDRNPTREEIKNAIKSFPCDTFGCRCRDCRYFRMCKRAKT